MCRENCDYISSQFINRELEMYLFTCIIMAWQHFSPEVTVKGFKRCCISCAVDETDDGVLWNGIEEDANIRSWCEEDDCEDGQSDSDW